MFFFSCSMCEACGVVCHGNHPIKFRCPRCMASLKMTLMDKIRNALTVKDLVSE